MLHWKTADPGERLVHDNRRDFHLAEPEIAERRWRLSPKNQLRIMTTTLLFDIDGTLISTKNAGSRSIDRVFQEVFQIQRQGDLKLHGRTDRAILSELLTQHGIEASDENFLRFTQKYLPALDASLSQYPGIVLPGIVDLLDFLAPQPHVALGLLTGNIQAGAMTKLRHNRLDRFFQFGGYGDLHANRDDVARAARQAAIEHLGERFMPDKVVVIGDTIHDITCGRAIGATVIAVLTGGAERSQLEALKPDYLCDDLSAGIDLFQQIIAV